MSDDINPYAATNSSNYGQSPPLTGGIVPTVVDAGSIISYAIEVWKANLKLLVSTSAVFFGVMVGLVLVQLLLTAIFGQLGLEGLGVLLGFGVNLVSGVAQVFFGIGQAQIALKLLRGQPAQFGDLFAGGPMFLPVLGASVLGGFAIWLGLMACVIPGVLLFLFFWPFYWLVVDQKTRVMDSFGVALPIAKVNVVTSLLLWLVTMAVVLLGFLALIVGVVFAIPLVTLIWGTAYLMMAGLLSPQPRTA